MGDNFLGKGWSFPPAFYEGGAAVVLISGEKDIEQSLQIILSTSLNERIMNSGFGCDLRQFLFGEIDNSLISQLRNIIERALLKYEPRIKVEKVDVLTAEASNGLLNISVSYLVPASNNRYNMVYPYYLTEANI
jgi:phage baseplate assembly protein W